MTQAGQPESPGGNLSYFAVLCLDVLGQTERMKDLKVPENDAQIAEAIRILKGTYGVVQDVREAWARYIRVVGNREDTSHLTPEQLAALPLLDVKIEQWSFSDTVVCYVRLADTGNNLPLLSVYHLLLAAGFILIPFLARGVALDSAQSRGVCYQQL